MTVAQVRTIIADKYQYDRAVMIADGLATDYALPNPPVKANTEKVYVNGVLKAEGADYALDDDLGLIAFTAPPAGAAQVVASYQWSILSDGDIATFLALNTDVRLAAAMALDTIASSEALVQKVIHILDLSTDGAAVAAALRAHAKSLREEVATDIALDDVGSWDWAEHVVDQATLLERMQKQSSIG